MNDPTQTESVIQIPNPEWFTEFADSVARHWAAFASATDPVSQAYALTELNDAMAALRTYLPGYGYETGTLPWERDEEVIDDDDEEQNGA